jgi:galactokinase/mevalonate kinase-like predicted kinase
MSEFVSPTDIATAARRLAEEVTQDWSSSWGISRSVIERIIEQAFINGARFYEEQAAGGGG